MDWRLRLGRRDTIIVFHTFRARQVCEEAVDGQQHGENGKDPSRHDVCSWGLVGTRRAHTLHARDDLRLQMRKQTVSVGDHSLGVLRIMPSEAHLSRG